MEKFVAPDEVGVQGKLSALPGLLSGVGLGIAVPENVQGAPHPSPGLDGNADAGRNRGVKIVLVPCCYRKAAGVDGNVVH